MPINFARPYTPIIAPDGRTYYQQDGLTYDVNGSSVSAIPPTPFPINNANPGAFKTIFARAGNGRVLVYFQGSSVICGALITSPQLPAPIRADSSPAIIPNLTNGITYTFSVTPAIGSNLGVSQTLTSTPTAFIASTVEPIFWLRASSLGLGNGAAVASVTDQSGNAWPVYGGAQAQSAAAWYGTTGANPTMNTSGINSLPAINFSGAAGGSAQYLTVPSLTMTQIGARCSVFMVFRLASATNASANAIQVPWAFVSVKNVFTFAWPYTQLAFSNAAGHKGGAAGNSVNVYNGLYENNNLITPYYNDIITATNYVHECDFPGLASLNGAACTVQGGSSGSLGVFAQTTNSKQWQRSQFPSSSDASNSFLSIGTTGNNIGAQNLQGLIAELIITPPLTAAQSLAVRQALYTTYGISGT